LIAQIQLDDFDQRILSHRNPPIMKSIPTLWKDDSKLATFQDLARAGIELTNEPSRHEHPDRYA
jgi:hypothetical protein